MTSMIRTQRLAASFIASTRTPGFRNAVRSEWVKLSSLRSCWITLGAGSLLALAMTVLVSMGNGRMWDTHPEMFKDFNPATWSLDAAIVSAMAFGVLGAIVMAGEYSSGQIRLTLATTPRRGRILASKALVAGALAAATGLVVSPLMFIASQLIYGWAGMPTANLVAGESLRAVVLLGLLGAVYAILGVSAGSVLRSTAGAITAVLGLIIVPTLFGGLLPASWQEHFIAYFPGEAIRSLACGDAATGRLTYLEPSIAAIAIVAWLTVSIGGAYLALTRRDA